MTQEEIREAIEDIFPELKESEEERIIREITEFILTHRIDEPNDIEDTNAWLTWLEKQGQKPQGKTALEAIHEEKMNNANKVEPKFKVGDYVVGEYISGYISEVRDDCYLLDYQGFSIDKQDNYHLWTIQDAKDGDVLVYNNSSVEIILLFKKWINGVGDGAYSYAHTFNNEILFNDWSDCGYATHPATKEQRKLLFQKMKEAGYEWDEEKKELKKIENEIEIPFSVKDSELQEVTYYIPKGFHAEIEGNNVVIKKGEQNPAWSEEDERIILSIEQVMNCASLLNIVPEKVDKIRTWLKSLRPKKQWKPSDEQMAALSSINVTGGVSYVGQGQELINLYNDLKKLMEEQQ